jgi:glycosyltransferase involved in cell wall biosynthesis
MAANLANEVIVHCDRARGLLAARFGRRRNVHVVPHPNFIGIYPNTVPADEARMRLGLAPHETVILFFGGIRPNKGIERLISAFSQLPGKDLRLVIAGKPWPPPEYVEGLLDLASRDLRVRLYPRFIADEEVQVFLNAANAVVLPFSKILTSGSAMLAMSFEKPVVAPAMGCLPEMVTEDAGILYDPDAPDALLNALRRCTEADLRAMGERSLRRAQGFDTGAIAARTLAAYGYEACPLPATLAVGPISSHVGREQQDET